MAHLVTNINNSKGDLVLKGIPAWHGLGTVIEDQTLTTKQVLEFSGLDFFVEKAHNYHRLPALNGNGFASVKSDKSFFTYRTDKNIVLAPHVGSDYKVIQNNEALNLMDVLMEKGLIEWETAGALNNGATTFITGKVKTNIVVGKDDFINQYVVISNTHDGSTSLRAYFTNVRIVCNNTLQFSLKDAKQLHRIRHTASATDRLAEAIELMGFAHKNEAAASEAYNAMAKVQLKQNDFWNYLGNVFFSDKEVKAIKTGTPVVDAISTQKKNLMDGVIKFAETGIGQAEAVPGTGFWAYNAVTGYFSNEKDYKTQGRRYENLLFAEDHQTMTTAFNLALHPERIVPLTSSFNFNISNN